MVRRSGKTKILQILLLQNRAPVAFIEPGKNERHYVSKHGFAVDMRRMRIGLGHGGQQVARIACRKIQVVWWCSVGFLQKKNRNKYFPHLTDCHTGRHNVPSGKQASGCGLSTLKYRSSAPGLASVLPLPGTCLCGGHNLAPGLSQFGQAQNTWPPGGKNTSR